jgi:prepilin-type N-terminal cleavage/methylation domain-containing protein
MNGKLGNQGFSLAEIIIAITIASIVIASVASMIFTSLNLFGRNNANVEMQNELQTTMNLVLDNIMEASGFCMVLPDDVTAPADPPGNTPMILLGELQLEELTSGKFKIVYQGMAIIFVEADLSLYLVDLSEILLDADYPPAVFPASNPLPGYRYLSGAVEYDSRDQALNAANGLRGILADIRVFFSSTQLTDAQRLAFLMGRNVEVFRVVPAGDPAMIFDNPTTPPVTISAANDGILALEHITYVDGSTENRYFFEEPFNVNMTIRVRATRGMGDVVNRSLNNDIAIRSRLRSIYLADGAGGPRGMQEYKRR